mgnify:FL=1|jgi:glutaredoxin
MTVKLYTSSNCPACVTLKGRLEGLGLTNYEEANVNVPKNREAVIALGFRGVPVLTRYDSEDNLVGSIMGASGADSAYKEMFV